MSRTIGVSCSGAGVAGLENPLVLDYRPNSKRRNVRLDLPRFVQDLYHIPERTLDLLEVAAYIYAADRFIRRGAKDAVEYQAWSRRFEFRIRVRDEAFWNRKDVQAALGACLEFMTGDQEYTFKFTGGHRTPPTSLFDSAEFTPQHPAATPRVALFSGGLDSLCGAVHSLVGSSEPLVLVSHESQPGTMRTQRALIDALRVKFAGRVRSYGFGCTLTGIRAVEETQRSRSFLYSAIGFAIAQAYGSRSLTIFENGVTSLNLRRREDLGNARASRTTHPRTVALLAEVLRLVGNAPFAVETPGFWMTKREVVERIASEGYAGLISSSVSCSRTFQRKGPATQCGRCFQCLDRRLAVYAAAQEAHDDAGLYTTDIIRAPVSSEEFKTTAVDYLRQAAALADSSSDSLYSEYLVDLADAFPHLDGGGTEIERIERVWKLMHDHGTNVKAALKRMREKYDDPLSPLPKDSLLGLVSSREHLRPEAHRLAGKIVRITSDAIGKMFRSGAPKDENDLNQKVAALIGSHLELASEHPTVPFASARVTPDHTEQSSGLLIEAKYIRDGTSPSKASEGMAADLTKYPADAYILFLVYDPTHRIQDDGTFKRDLESRGRCSVAILR